MLAAGNLLHIRVPATCANLGPGFDVMGLAVSLYNTFTVSLAGKTTVTVTDGKADMPSDESNLFYKSFAYLYTALSEQAPPLHIEMQLGMPTKRGLGSSATAVIGGLVAANNLLGEPLSKADLLKHAVELEQGRHADNVAPALLGGLIVSTFDGDDLVALPVSFPDDLTPVLFIPDFEMDTVQGRGLMPPVYPRDDMVFNTGKAALFLAALQERQYSLLRVGMQDRIHQPYRTRIFPDMPAIISAAIEAGACGACLSGGGSTILALADHEPEPVAEAMFATGRQHGVSGKAKITTIDRAGTQTWEEKREV